MPLHNELYLALVVVAFVGFTLSLAYCSWDEARRRRHDNSDEGGARQN